MENLLNVLTDIISTIFVDPMFMMVLIILLCIRNCRYMGILMLGLGIIFGFKLTIFYGVALVIYAIVLYSHTYYNDSIKTKSSKSTMGPEGPQGATGPQGDRGKSAYEYAVEGGYEGTEEEFTTIMSSIPAVITRVNSIYGVTKTNK